MATAAIYGLLAQHQLDRLLVMEEGDRLVGILSEADSARTKGPWQARLLAVGADGAAVNHQPAPRAEAG
jgi:hypothetical protein